jgi:hypothetical protein
VLKIQGFAVLLLVGGCGGSHAMRPDATGVAGTAGIDAGGGSSGSGGALGGVAIARTYTVGPNPRNVDILFLVDDSSSMAAAQGTLRQSFARFASALRNLPGGLPNLHIAVVSSDMGAGDGSISGCAGAGKNGVFQYSPRGTCTSTGLQAGWTFISDAGGTKNYSGNLEDVLGCISALGESGCGFEHQFAAITRALGADGKGAPPAENAGFLRQDAYLAIVMLTNEDDCSAQDSVPLYDTTANLNLASQLGPPANFRCNEFGHLCDGTPPQRNSPTGTVTATMSYQSCVSAEGAGLLATVSQTAAQLKALKADPANQIVVASIQGPPTPYQVHWKPASASDTGPWPEVTHACTAANASFADPGVRTAQLVGQFGGNGLLSSICDADFGPALDRVAAWIGAALAGPCITEAIADDAARAGYQPQCSAQVWVGNASQGAPSCADNGGTAPCWSLSTDGAGCQQPQITVAAGATPMPVVHYECAVCTTGVVGQGCSDPPPTGGSVSRTPIFGQTCDVGVSVGNGPGSVSIIASPAPGCASRVCLLPGAEKDPRGTGALCTSSCTTNADCEAGYLGDRNDPNDHRCKTGFACTVPTTVGPFCCQRLCVCRDFVSEPLGGFQTPPICMPGGGGSCQNVR